MTQHLKPVIHDGDRSEPEPIAVARDVAPRKPTSLVVSQATQERIDRLTRAMRQANLKVPFFGRL